MKAIWKYPLVYTPLEQPVAMPAGSTFRLFSVQNGNPCVWYEVEQDEPDTEVRFLRVIGTGHAIPEETLIHLGSCVAPPFVWHLYEKVEEKQEFKPVETG